MSRRPEIVPEEIPSVETLETAENLTISVKINCIDESIAYTFDRLPANIVGLNIVKFVEQAALEAAVLEALVLHMPWTFLEVPVRSLVFESDEVRPWWTVLPLYVNGKLKTLEHLAVLFAVNGEPTPSEIQTMMMKSVIRNTDSYCTKSDLLNKVQAVRTEYALSKVRN